VKTFGRPRVLVCDDEATVRLVIERALGQAGYDVTTVECGLDAVAAARSEAFDVILLDVRLPDMDGPEVLAALRETDPDAPCLVISGYSAFEDAIRCLRQGAAEFVRKPFDIETVVRAVDRVLVSTHLKVDSALLAASQSIFSSLDPKEIVNRVLRVTLTLLHSDEATITLCDDAQTPTQTWRIGDAMSGDDVLRPPLEASATLRRLLAVHDPVLLSRESPGDHEMVTALSPSAKTILAQRLRVGDRPVGVLAVARGEGSRKFGERDVRRIMLLAGHVALALENARLHAESAAKARDLEKALDQLVAAERIASIGRLSSGIGHEISNPACSVLAYLEVARDALAAGRTKEAADAIARAQVGANAVLDVCHALRPLASRRSRSDVVIDLKQVVDGALLLAIHELRTKARVAIDIPEKLPLLVGDPAKLGQVFLNLLLNAGQAIEPHAPDKNEVRIKAWSEPDAVIVRVEDTGRGVAPEILPRLFEPSVTTKSSEGHGLGLAICKWITEELGGSIRCVPDVERGAVFEVRLPTRRPAETVTSP
jgi:signal transduction histidine kinase/ActR/RegA family two-component response regulator